MVKKPCSWLKNHVKSRIHKLCTFWWFNFEFKKGAKMTYTWVNFQLASLKKVRKKSNGLSFSSSLQLIFKGCDIYPIFRHTTRIQWVVLEKTTSQSLALSWHPMEFDVRRRVCHFPKSEHQHLDSEKCSTSIGHGFSTWSNLMNMFALTCQKGFGAALVHESTQIANRIFPTFSDIDVIFIPKSRIWSPF